MDCKKFYPIQLQRPFPFFKQQEDENTKFLFIFNRHLLQVLNLLLDIATKRDVSGLRIEPIKIGTFSEVNEVDAMVGNFVFVAGMEITQN